MAQIMRAILIVGLVVSWLRLRVTCRDRVRLRS
jgi:hypothetical protein